MEGKECPHCRSKNTEIAISTGYTELWDCFRCKKTFFVRGGLIDKPQKES